MEADFFTNDMFIEEPSEADENANNDNLFIEGEKCGICMDIVIDRGVLDCCQHWFCFACIDNWASITNLCPLCQNEFQLITCVPVYDTIGSNKIEDDMLSRDDDWSIEGKNNTLSFPSYYIDENAVVCLDGDGCKIRSGSANCEGDLSLDTSIACDSCDIWYHAFCVGFDTEGTSDVTWLCPRCVPDKGSDNMDANSLEKTTMKINPENGDKECQAEGFSGKVSVSVVDAGETAVVVSLVEGNQWIPLSREKGLSPLESSKNSMTESFVSISDTNNHQSNTEKTINSPREQQELELSLSHNLVSSLSSNTLGPGDLKKGTYDERNDPSSLSGTKIFNESHDRASTSRNGSDMGLHIGLSVGSFLCADDTGLNATRDQETDLQHQQSSSEETNLEGDEMEKSDLKDNARVTGEKRKHADLSNDEVHIEVDIDAELKPEVEVSQKKLRTEGRLLINHENVAGAPLSDNTKTNPSITTISRHVDVKHGFTEENAASDIMSIVKGTKWKPSKETSGSISCNISKNKENMAGLRVKKIMKRAPDHADSSLVQNLREEIRDAVRNKSSKDFEENLFDTKLLAAFRAAVAGPKTEPPSRPSPMALKAKKSMLQKGKVREHLTRKIFGTSNGRRKRAWDRDCEIEFWKYRCTRATKPEKIETLKSVLGLLRNSSESAESKKGPDGRAKSSILSRLYLADTSVFPRKDDVKPLSVFETAANSEQNKKPSLSGKASNQSLDNSPIKEKEINNVVPKARYCSSENKVNKKVVNSSAGGNSASGNVPSSRHSEGSTSSCPGGSRDDSKESHVKSECIKSDKRKWALEVLARKTAAAGKKMTDDNREDNAMLGGNYPLLAQLPADMRPVLALSRHNKIPISVRQTQLYRLTEHFLRNASLSVIRRTAHTELAVADAINIEKEVVDRSNSKLVYLNLCSQELLHRSNNRKSNGTADIISQASSAVPTDRSEQNTDDDLSIDSAVQIALKNAGLSSDSPPCSPSENREIFDKEVDLSGPDNILELNFQPEMDIYGDFDYDLEDEDYIGAGVGRGLNSREEESESKMKLVFSSMNLKNSDTVSDCMDSESLEGNEVPRDPSCSSKHDDMANRDPAINAETGNPHSAPSEALFSEPCDAECEELYGPEKEPLAKKFPHEEFITLHGEGKSGTSTEGSGCHDKGQASDQAVNASECENNKLAKNMPVADNSSNASDISENLQRKGEKSDTVAGQSDSANHVARKVEAYIKEHIRPLCRSRVITSEQYRWAVAKTTEKVMKYHCKAKNANFLIKEGEKVKKLAEQYVEAAQHNRKN